VGVEIYEKMSKLIDINSFKEVIRGSGMNPFKFFDSIKMDKTVEEVVREREIIEEAINVEAIQRYIIITPSDVNRFNLTVDENFDKDTDMRKKLTNLKKILQTENDIKKRSKMTEEINNLESEIWKKYEIKDKIKEGEKLRNNLKKNKLREKSRAKVVVNNHVDKKNYD